MQKWIGLILFGLLAILVESSLLAWPFALIYVYLILDSGDKGSMFWLMVMGVLLDVLTVRTVGISSLGLLVFFGVLIFLRRSFSGNLRIEGLWFLLSTFVWNFFLGTGGGYLILGLLILGVVLFNRQLSGREIKLR